MDENIVYSQVESDFELSELEEHPEKFLVIGLETLIICTNCHQRLTYKKTEAYVSMLCGCGCRTFYPKNEKGAIISKFTSKEEWEKNKERVPHARTTIATRTDD